MDWELQTTEAWLLSTVSGKNGRVGLQVSIRSFSVHRGRKFITVRPNRHSRGNLLLLLQICRRGTGTPGKKGDLILQRLRSMELQHLFDESCRTVGSVNPPKGLLQGLGGVTVFGVFEHHQYSLAK